MLDPTLFARGLHGHVGLLAAVALAHPAWTLRDDGAMRKGTRWSVALATALTTIAVVAGWLLYPAYRDQDKPRLLHYDRALAMLFETKEHLAFYALALAWAGAALALFVRDPRAPRAARRCFGLAAALVVAAGVMGTAVGSFAVPAAP